MRECFGHPCCKVKTWDGKPMYYYKNWKVPGNTAGDLLFRNDGQCDSWANFFIQVLQTQGIGHKTNPVGGVEANPVIPAVLSVVRPAEFQPPAGAKFRPNLFLVKEWEFPANATTTDFSYKNEFQELVKKTRDGFEYDFQAGAQVTDKPGLPGQNTKNPISSFRNHVIVHIFWADHKAYYDPSYGGTPFTYATDEKDAWKAFESAAIEGFVRIKLERNNPVTTWEIRKNDGGNNLDIELEDI